MKPVLNEITAMIKRCVFFILGRYMNYGVEFAPLYFNRFETQRD